MDKIKLWKGSSISGATRAIIASKLTYQGTTMSRFTVYIGAGKVWKP
jgi:hypothetical protein